jgi:hypothetical protein
MSDFFGLYYSNLTKRLEKVLACSRVLPVQSSLLKVKEVVTAWQLCLTLNAANKREDILCLLALMKKGKFWQNFVCQSFVNQTSRPSAKVSDILNL